MGIFADSRSEESVPLPEMNAAAERRLRDHHRACSGQEPDAVARAPGRVNLIGDHTDYMDGLCLPAAIGLYVYAAASRRPDGLWRFHAAGEASDLEVDPGLAETPDQLTCPRWALYPLGVARAMDDVAPLGFGFDVTFAASLPAGQGLGSSAALEVGAAVALHALAGRSFEPLAIARLACDVERRAAGVQCGMLDQVATAMGRAGQALFLDCRDLTTRPIALPLDRFALVVVQSGRPRALSGVGYNDRRRETREALEALSSLLGKPLAPGDVTVPDLDLAASGLTPRQRRRLYHVVTENERVRRCVEALERGDDAAVRALFLASHRSLRFDFEVSTPELDHLVELALAHHPKVAARLTGAGFGGCTVNLVPLEALDGFRREVPRRFRSRFKVDARALAVPVVDAASRVA